MKIRLLQDHLRSGGTERQTLLLARAFAGAGHAAEIMKEAIIGMRAAGLGPYMVLPVHDEVVMSVPRNMAREVAHEMETIMGGVVDPEEYGVPVKASSYIADRWGESEK